MDVWVRKKLQNDWTNDPPYNFTGNRLEYNILPKEYEKEYFILLADRQYIIFPEDKFEEIIGRKKIKNYVIAVRAVYTNIGGEYRILENEYQEISIRYYILGRVFRINKSILLLEVDSLPKNIYVSEFGAI